MKKAVFAGIRWVSRSLFWLCWAAQPALAAPSVRFLVLDAHAMPFSEFRQNAAGQLELTDGIVKDWQEALAHELKRTPVNLFYSRRRQDQAVATGKVDLRCFVSPDWMAPELRARYDWPPPFMRMEERLAGPYDKALIHSAEQLRGKSVGMVLGYYYPTLNPLLNSRAIRRDNASNEAGVLEKQLAGRTDYMAIRTLDFYYQRKSGSPLQALQLSPLVISNAAIHCARPKTSRVPLNELLQAQQRLLEAGALDKILLRYR